MKKVIIPGKVKGGLFVPQFAKNWSHALGMNEGKDVLITIERPGKKRTNPQNSYLWSVPYKMIAEETGDDVESVHHHLAGKFLSSPGHVVQKIGSTSKLETGPFNTYLDNIIQWAAEFLNLYIPYPNEEELWGDTKRKI